jgi:hypothetical protein
VGGAGGAECVLRAVGGEAGEQDGIFVAFACGGIDREPEECPRHQNARLDAYDVRTSHV